MERRSRAWPGGYAYRPLVRTVRACMHAAQAGQLDPGGGGGGDYCTCAAHVRTGPGGVPGVPPIVWRAPGRVVVCLWASPNPKPRPNPIPNNQVASWSVIGLPETGAVVLWLHAASDIFIDLLKACDA